ncbi:MAG: hypothetical protein XE11_0947 [Methanomicrobiales archaeon 53_19]|jgi:energy-converting hydrogenase A subunit D|uniref:DUF2108 domain-containing protein n=1 Tax=Methanocalculus sp. TaxID=2004547 RepID=UPI00074A4962|nr:DUF2108 domain-containing protein [Methanocalculus sp.]KUK71099.1 MAG: hypothetical protein XD88_0270 [Methanocalculus sp. 52_23]KUL03953.1 MAG: hypothetical protein XE11_0947 [Methanomicrobiales archaeon 53_19]HIJ06341.1 DUF2108 domain-containing protein [Methanocalculus sp.]
MIEEIILPGLTGLIFLGAVTTALWKNPFDKLIGLSLLSAGVIPLIVMRGYLDVAILVALVTPISTIFILLLLGRQTS